MSVGWYLDAQGRNHLLHLDERWTELALEPDQVPTDSAVPVGIVDGGVLADRLAQIVDSYLGEGWTARTAAGQEPEEQDPHRAALQDSLAMVLMLTRGEDPAVSRIACAASDAHGDAQRQLPCSALFDSSLELPLTPSVAVDLAGLRGRCILSLGADEQWRTVLVARTDTALRRTVLPRRSSPVILGRTRSEDPGSFTAPARQLLHLLDLAREEEEMTLAIVPGRLILRGPAGVIGTLEGEFAGTARTGTFDAAATLLGLRALPESPDGLTLTIGPDGACSLLVASPVGEQAWSTRLEKTWSYT